MHNKLLDKDADEIYICTECIPNEHISEAIKSFKQSAFCSYCEESYSDFRHVVLLDAIINEIDEYFRDHYGLGKIEPRFYGDSDKPDYEQKGEDLPNCISELLRCDYDIAEVITRELNDTEYHVVKDGGEPFYDDGKCYESLAEMEAREEAERDEYWYENRVKFQWDEFCKYVKYNNRFFSIKAKLDEIFGYADSYKEGNRCPVYKISKGTKIYRARKLENGIDHNKIKHNPLKELGPPPAISAINGRMNVKHIPVFYGAFEQEVAVCETQPFIEEDVAVGEFSVTNDITVFDFTVYDRIFDKEYADSSSLSKYSDTRYEVLKHMQEAISKPISASNKSLDYIPTQIVTEYIREHFKVDGIIYFSSLVTNKEESERRNIVIFDDYENGMSEYGKLSIEVSNVTFKCVRAINYDIGTSSYDLF